MSQYNLMLIRGDKEQEIVPERKNSRREIDEWIEEKI